MRKSVKMGLLVLATASLVACGQQGQQSEKVYNYIYYGAEADTLDYTVSSRGSTKEITSNTIDGLLENDRYGNLIPSLAEDWTVSADGLTYTYKLRKGVKWLTNDGEEYGEVKAQDFVTGLKHAADAQSEALYIVQQSVKGLQDYVDGRTKDFADVGVKALDDYTVQYTLNAPESYWNSKTTLGVLAPVNAEFLENKAGEFGQAGKPDSLLYNGPFLLSVMTSKSIIEMVKNPSYWDKDNVHLDKVKLVYVDGDENADTSLKGFQDGTYTTAKLSPNSSNFKEVRKKAGDNVIYDEPSATTYAYAFNIDRQNYQFSSKKSDAEKDATKKAFLNKDFRQAINFAFDRHAYSAQSHGTEAADKNMRTSFVPPTFVQLGDKDFSQVVEEKLVNYGTEWQGVKLSDNQDSLYSPEKAKQEFAKAKESLQAQGVQFPIHIDLPTNNGNVKRVQSFKQSVESALGAENVQVDLQILTDADYDNITFFATTAAQQDWDLSLIGWSGDYQDPSTYLDSLDSQTGENTKFFLGFESGSQNPAAKAAGFEEYDRLIDTARNEKQDILKRYEDYAQAQAWLTDSALLMPAISTGGTPKMTKEIPYTSPYGLTGDKAVTYKYVEISDKAISSQEREKAREKWLKEKQASNQKAQEELAKHVK